MKKFQLPAADVVARTFCRHLRDLIGPRKLALVVKRNAQEEHSGVCHSHDFCDANVVMEGAFLFLTAKDTHDLSLADPDYNQAVDGIMSSAVSGVWSDAWELAQLARFNPDKVGEQITYSVQYHIEVSAQTPREAAEQARAVIRNPEANLGQNYYVRKWRGKQPPMKGWQLVDLAD